MFVSCFGADHTKSLAGVQITLYNPSMTPHLCMGFWVVGGVLAINPAANGQAFNIDVAGNQATPPDSTYGAGASQPGFWNPAGLSTVLSDLSGNPTTAHFFGVGGTIHTIPGATGNDKRLMETVFEMAPSDSLTITSLTAGRYNLYAYRWAPTPATAGFSVYNGATTVGGYVTSSPTWPGSQVEGVTFVRIPVEVIDGRNYLRLSVGSGGDSDILAGIQLVPVPAPGAAVVLAGAGVIAIRRRR